MNGSTNDWRLELQSIEQDQKSRLLTATEFARCISRMVGNDTAGLNALRFEIRPKAPFCEKIVGFSSSVVPLSGETDVTTLHDVDEHGTEARVLVWRNHDTAQSSERVALPDRDEFRVLLDGYWKGRLRDARSHLLSLQFPTTETLADDTLHYFVREHGSAAVCYLDLDRFKQVNESFDHQKGDEVILAFASLLDDAVADKGVVLHRSGDEFSILLPGATAVEVLRICRSAMDRVRGFDFDVGAIDVGVSAGVAFLTTADPLLSYNELEKRAEEALTPDGQEKQRGKVRIFCGSTASRATEVSAEAIDLACCIVKSNPLAPEPFANPWLNFISYDLASLVAPNEVDFAEVRHAAEQLLRWISPDLDNMCLVSSLGSGGCVDAAAVLSPVDITLAAAHGIFRGMLSASAPRNATLELRHSSDFSACNLLVTPSESPLFGVGVSSTDAEWQCIDLGSVASLARNGAATRQSLHTALLVKIGHRALSIPRSLFADVLIVDDRPTRGGGLPDFWEALIARLIARVAAEQSIQWVFVLGDETVAKETSRRLRDVANWTNDTEHLSYKTGRGPSEIHAAAARLRAGVHFFVNETALIRHFSTALRNTPAAIPAAPVATPSPLPTRFLVRSLDTTAIALRPADGVRVKTIAEAFPVVLAIARQADNEEPIRDQAGQELNELVDFRVHLSEPLRDQVPAFYRREAQSLSDYSRRVFFEPDSLFGKRFNQDGQLDAVLQHVRAALLCEQPYATRRAVLVVPHEIYHDQDLTPLGLISIRIIPRFSGRRLILGFSFTWRTVEAFVGFPYSIYGSVKFAEHLTQLVATEELVKRWGDPVFGSLSYIAHSLHIFIDDYGRSIARRIVDDASI